MVENRLQELNYLKILKSLGYSAEHEIEDELRRNWRYSWDNARPAELVHISKIGGISVYIQNFLYHRDSGMFMINFESGMHSMMQTAFEALIAKKTHPSDLREHCKAEFFILKDRGMLLSSIKDEVLISPTFSLNAQEKQVLRRLGLSTEVILT